MKSITGQGMKRSVKTGLTMAQHEIAGHTLKLIDSDLCHLFVDVANAYPRTHKLTRRVLRQIEKARRAIIIARSDMEDTMAIEWPKELSLIHI